MEKIAGMESTANNKSVNSTIKRTKNNLVATNFLSMRVKNLAPSYFGEILKNFVKIRENKLFS